MVYALQLPQTGYWCFRFSVYLQCGPHESNDVGFVFDARFNFGDQRKVTVRNHKVGGAWGAEETHGAYFPFAENNPFDIMILIEQLYIKASKVNLLMSGIGALTRASSHSQRERERERES